MFNVGRLVSGLEPFKRSEASLKLKALASAMYLQTGCSQSTVRFLSTGVEMSLEAQDNVEWRLVVLSEWKEREGDGSQCWISWLQARKLMSLNKFTQCTCQFSLPKCSYFLLIKKIGNA